MGRKCPRQRAGPTQSGGRQGLVHFQHREEAGELELRDTE